jgi:hypothetical protein
MTSDVGTLVRHCRTTLDLAGAHPPTEFYQSLPLCVIDTVFSINANYQSTQNTVARFCAYFDVPYRSPMRYPPLVEQLSIGRFLNDYDTYGLNFFADAIYKNRQRTSTTNGILKAEAVQRFAQVLRDVGVQYL